MHSILKRNSWAILAAATLLIAVSVSWFSFAKANPLEIGTSNNTATTTTVSLAPGAVGTYTYDLWNGGAGEQVAADKMALAIQMAASSTSTVLNWNYQFSENGSDWYDDNTATPLAGTTTVSNVQGVTWTASTTNVTRKIVTLPTPTRYVRVNFYVTGANASIWATFISQKQQQS